MHCNRVLNLLCAEKVEWFEISGIKHFNSLFITWTQSEVSISDLNPNRAIKSSRLQEVNLTLDPWYSGASCLLYMHDLHSSCVSSRKSASDLSSFFPSESKNYYHLFIRKSSNHFIFYELMFYSVFFWPLSSVIVALDNSLKAVFSLCYPGMERKTLIFKWLEPNGPPKI